MALSKEQEQLVLDNQRLVYYFVHKLGYTPNSSEYEDIASIGKIGLVKAAITFDMSKNTKFSSYASKCIKNEIFMYQRKTKHYENNISIDHPIHIDKEGNELTLVDMLEDPDSDFLEKISVKEDFVRMIGIVLNFLEGKERVIILYSIAGLTQIEIAKKINISRSFLSRIFQRSINKIKQASNQQLHYKEAFSMEIVEDEYRISFSSKDITKFNKIFATLLQNLQSAKNLPSFRVNCNSERILIQLPADPHSFSFIAQIIQEIDNFSMTFVSNKSVTFKEINNEKPGKIKCITEDVKKEPAKKRRGISKQIRDYMYTMDGFTVKQIKEHFPDYSNQTIGYVIFSAKKEGLITAKGRGEYVVNKN